jgi:hypothetical protein
MDAKDKIPENKESEGFLEEMILEDFKTIESNAAWILEGIELIHRRAKQARQLLEVQKSTGTKHEKKKQFYQGNQGGPWSNALRAMSERDRRLSEKEWRENFDRVYNFCAGEQNESKRK